MVILLEERGYDATNVLGGWQEIKSCDKKWIFVLNLRYNVLLKFLIYKQKSHSLENWKPKVNSQNSKVKR
jgi:hypothetical protein